MTTTRRLIGGAGQRLARGTKRLPKVKPPGAIKAKVGVGKPGSSAGTKGITSPLTEVIGLRTYYDDRTVDSTDGMFQLVYRPLRTIAMKDATGAVFVFSFDNVPPSPAP